MVAVRRLTYIGQMEPISGSDPLLTKGLDSGSLPSAMRLPVRSERDAFQITWAAAAVIALAVVLGALITPLVGVAVVVITVIAAVVWDVRAANPDHVDTLREAAGAGRRRSAIGAQPRLLVVANQTL